jgi:Rps23 Pro-64 3,4-dihydroxylase Tpa1-like proline 4-hydroxylase
VYACEPDGRDYGTAPDLITYIAVLLRTLPDALNGESLTKDMDLSSSCFNAKLAATTAGGSRYPCHIDNPVGNDGMDVRKLTCILYLNPGWVQGEGGEIRLFVNNDDASDAEKKKDVETVDLSPVGGRLLLFWSDEIPHEVLPTKASTMQANENTSESTYSESDRYALTVWIPTENRGVLHDERSKFACLKDFVRFG